MKTETSERTGEPVVVRFEGESHLAGLTHSYTILVALAPDQAPLVALGDFHVPAAWAKVGTGDQEVVSGLFSHAHQVLLYHLGVRASRAEWILIDVHRRLASLIPCWAKPGFDVELESEATTAPTYPLVDISWTDFIGNETYDEVIRKFGARGLQIILCAKAAGMPWASRYVGYVERAGALQ